MATLTYRDALNQALREEMQRDADVFLMGEEVGVYQGAYKVSRGLLEEFGPKRIVDTPIAELGFAGIGVGAAMAGLRPVIEFMTWNFAVLALDQIVNSAAKILYESGGQIPIPIVFRGPNGAALQLAAQHSQAWDSWLSHIPGLKVVAPATPADAKGLLKSAIRDNNPVIVLEGEMLYNLKGEVPDGEHIVPIGRAEVKRPGSDVTLICHSKTVAVALKAAEQLAEHEGASAEVLDLRSLRPRDACSTSTDRGHQRLYGSALSHHGGRARGQVAQAGRRRGEGRRDAGRGRDRQGGDGPGRARGRRAAAGGGGRGADGAGGERGGRHRGAGRERQRSVGHSPAWAGGKGETGNGKRGGRDCSRTCHRHRAVRPSDRRHAGEGFPARATNGEGDRRGPEARHRFWAGRPSREEGSRARAHHSARGNLSRFPFPVSRPPRSSVR